MSIRHIQTVLESALPSRLKLVAVVMANFADQHGRKIFPSVELVRRLAGKGRRAVQNDLRTLRDMGVLAPEKESLRGGRSRTTRYVFHLEHLPVPQPASQRAQGGSHFSDPNVSEGVPTSGTRSAASSAPFLENGRDVAKCESASCRDKRVQCQPERALRAAPDPSDPPEIHESTEALLSQRHTHKDQGGQDTGDSGADFRRLCVIVRDYLSTNPGVCVPDALEDIKTAASRAKLAYSTESVLTAMNAVKQAHDLEPELPADADRRTR